jgi:hypothetical protein
MKGNLKCHIPNDKYRGNYDKIFSKPKPQVLMLEGAVTLSNLASQHIFNGFEGECLVIVDRDRVGEVYDLPGFDSVRNYPAGVRTIHRHEIGMCGGFHIALVAQVQLLKIKSR